MTNDDKDLKQQLIELAWEIEKLPASEQQTKVITMLTDIRSKATPQQPSEDISLNTRPYNPVPSFAKGIKDALDQPSEKKSLSVEDFARWMIHIKKDVKSEYAQVSIVLVREFLEYIDAQPAQREVRYPEKLDCKCKIICLCGNWHQLPKGEVWNSCIDEFKKLNS